MTETASTRAAIYCRVSTSMQEQDGTSLGSQEFACRRYAAEHGYSVSETHVFRETFSGAEFHERPRLGELRAALRARQFDVLVSYAVDRLSRDQVHIWLLLDEVDRAGARLEMVTESFDDSPTGKFLLSARAFAAEVERQKFSERAARGRLALARAGRLYAPGTDRYGYRRVPGENRREVYELEAAVVRDIFESYGVRNEPLRALIRRLNESGVPSPGAGKRNLGRRTYWGKGVLYRMLIDPVYKGETYALRWRGHKKGNSTHVRIKPREEWIQLPEGVTPAIVSTELWNAAQQRLAANRGDATRNEDRPYLLRGLMLCAVCGLKLRSSPERNRRVYRCASRETPAGPCGAKRVPADGVEQWVWNEVSAFLRNPTVIIGQAEKSRRRGPDPALTRSLEASRKALAKVEQGQERLMARFRQSDTVPWELVEREIGRAETERKQLLATISDVEQRLSAQRETVRHWSDVEAYCKRVGARIDGFGFTEKRLALEALMVVVTANGGEWSLGGSVPLEDGVQAIWTQ